MACTNGLAIRGGPHHSPETTHEDARYYRQLTLNRISTSAEKANAKRRDNGEGNRKNEAFGPRQHDH